MSELAVQESLAILPAVEGTETALVLPPDLSEVEWRAFGEKLGRAARASAWWIGDWINYGEDAGYVSRENYDIAEALTGMKRNTLWHYAHVARRVESFRRLKDLSYSHHEPVASLPSADQDDVLARAAAEGWSSTRVRKETRTNPAKRVNLARRHAAVIVAAAAFAKTAEGWDAQMCVSLAPPEARKQLTVLRKAQERLAEVIEAVEYRAATLQTFAGR